MGRIVVTGGAGFVGSHLCEALLARGDQVIAVDNFSTGSVENVSLLLDEPGFELVEADVVDALPVRGTIDGVFHLASPASPPAYLERPLDTMLVGSVGTRRALELALANDARFLLASTSEIYGDPLVHPQTEDYFGNVDTIGPRAVYDEAKRFAETLTMTYFREFDVRTTIVRIFNTYGPRLQPGDGRVVSNFIVQALNDKPLTMYGDGLQTRSFCYVADQVRGLIALFDSDVWQPVNIGNPVELTMLELAGIVREITGSSSGLDFCPLPKGDPTRRKPDITRARTLLGWQPEVDLRTGLSRTSDWFAANSV